MTNIENATAPELLKAHGITENHRIDVGGVLRKLADDKGYDIAVLRAAARRGQLGQRVGELLTRVSESTQPSRLSNGSSIIDYFGQRLDATRPASITGYRGLHQQNTAVDQTLASNILHLGEDGDFFFGNGAASHYRTSSVYLAGNATEVPVAIIGNGAASVIAQFALKAIGFNRITVFEKAKEPLGIWRMENVYRGSRNNPRDISFYGRDLSSAPGDGDEVRDFLSRLQRSSLSNSKFNTKITGVTPGNLNHSLKFTGSNNEVVEDAFPIVINTMGLGKPKPLSDPKRMTTPESNGGIRWQQQILNNGRAGKLKGKTLVFIGLGNSTAEMLQQVHKLIDEDHEIDYRVVTHYPKDSVYNPNDVVLDQGRNYRVFRDVSKPNLVDFQGDLPASRQDYYRALRSGKILYGVKSWRMQGKQSLVAYNQKKEMIENMRCDQLYTLTGYGHTRDSLTTMGCTWDDAHGCALFDYDGEFIRDQKSNDPNQRLYKGYFGFGSVLETPYNPNAIVIPGMIHRIGDLVFSVMLRAEEYARR